MYMCNVHVCWRGGDPGDKATEHVVFCYCPFMLVQCNWAVSIIMVSSMSILYLWNIQLTFDWVRIEPHGAYPRKSDLKQLKRVYIIHVQ